MATRYLSGWYEDAPTIFIKAGRYDMYSHGGPSTWIISNELDLNAPWLWAVPYRNKQYVYIFTAYNNEPETVTRFHELVVRSGAHTEFSMNGRNLTKKNYGMV